MPQDVRDAAEGGATADEVAEQLRVAETILSYQRATGGWPKNYDRAEPLTELQLRAAEGDRDKNDATIDNSATYTEVRLLAAAYQAAHDDRFRVAALKGIEYLLRAQYTNGGWPQRFPAAEGYARYITFNDNAMIGVLKLMHDVAAGNDPFSLIASELREPCRQAELRGVECILKCQVRVDGRLTVWCAQHHHETFAPERARAYELASLSGAESVGIVRFLIQIEAPGPDVVAAIEGATRWFEESKLTGIRVVEVKDAATAKGYDKIVVSDAGAPPMWARFYDIQTNQPIFCSRDGVPRRALADISYERRTGYSWLGYYAASLLDVDLPAWKRRIAASKVSTGKP
ncbi:MAG: pectate lyase [Planctomycetia bacterium]|nr:pectate lyase [Planctomycetia bacterium]